MAQIELFSFAACPYAQRTRMVLIEKGIDFELIEIDLYNRPPWFREVSPYGKVPLLRHDGRVVYESAIINQYLDEVFPSPPLLPADPYGRAQARIWMDYCETRYLPATHRLMAERGQPARLAENRAKLAEVMRFMEHEGLRKLGAGPYWMGSSPTLVDFQFLPFFERFAVYEELAGAEWPEDCTRLRDWHAALGERRSYLETRHTLDFHLEQQRKLSALRTAATANRAAGT
jgi:glutathione S-transferase